MAESTCPDCGADIFSQKPEVGKSLQCKQCGTRLEIIGDDPFDVDYLDYDDWEDDDDDDDDDDDEENW